MLRYDPGAPSSEGISASGTLGIDNAVAVPEPGIPLLAGAAVALLGVARGGRRPERRRIG